MEIENRWGKNNNNNNNNNKWFLKIFKDVGG